MLTEAVELRSVVLQELWQLASESSCERTGASEPASLRRVEDILHVCARGLVELLRAPVKDRERSRNVCVECAISVLGAFARTPSAPADAPQPAARLLLSTDRRLTARENSVLSGEKTYALDLDVLERIAATAGASSPSVEDDAEVRAADWQGVEQASLVVLLSAARAVANIDSGAPASALSQRAPTEVSSQLGLIFDHVDRATRELREDTDLTREESHGEKDRVGRLLSQVLRMGLPKQVMADLTRVDASSQALSEALIEMRSIWQGVAVRELEIVRILDEELPSRNYPQFGFLRQTVVAGAANVLVGGRLLDRPGDFLLLDALINQHDAVAHAVEFYAAALRGDADARTQTQLVVLTRLLRAVVALWIIDARLAQVSPTPSVGS